KSILSCKKCSYKASSKKEKLTSITDEKEKFILNEEIRVREIFSNHSIKGVRCPDCKNWIPESGFVDNLISCPYNCGFLGNINECSSSYHPCGTHFISSYFLPEGH